MNTELKENTRKNNFEMIFQVDGQYIFWKKIWKM